MEQAYVACLHENWNTEECILLCYIKEQYAILGIVTTIFARDKYQKHDGNICHNHLIIAIDKSTMNEK